MQRSVMVDVEAVSIQVFQRELPQAPRLLFQWFDNVCAGQFQLVVRGVDIRREYPMHSRLEWWPSFTEEDCEISPSRDCANRLVRLQPVHLETQHIAIVLLRALDVQDRQFRDGWSK